MRGGHGERRGRHGPDPQQGEVVAGGEQERPRRAGVQQEREGAELGQAARQTHRELQVDALQANLLLDVPHLQNLAGEAGGLVDR